MVVDEMLTTGHVRTLLALENKELQYNTAMKIFDEKLSVRETAVSYTHLEPEADKTAVGETSEEKSTDAAESAAETKQEEGCLLYTSRCV